LPLSRAQSLVEAKRRSWKRKHEQN